AFFVACGAALAMQKQWVPDARSYAWSIHRVADWAAPNSKSRRHRRTLSPGRGSPSPAMSQTRKHPAAKPAVDKRAIFVITPGSMIVIENMKAIEAKSASMDARAASPGALPLVMATLYINPALSVARELLEGGHVAAARRLLLHPVLSGTQEGAWLLARY